MKKFYICFLLASAMLSPVFVSAQHAQWLQSTAINYNLNPEITQMPSCAGAGKIFAARMVDYVLNYGVQNFGSMNVECYDPSGNLLWSFPMGPKLAVEDITADASGNVFLSGTFMETLSLDGTDTLFNTGTGLNTNEFLLSLDAAGNLRWKKNMTISNTDVSGIPALAIDPQNNCWYGCVFFDSTSIRKLDVNGNDVQSFLITGTRTLGNFDFDAGGNIFLSGSTGFLTLAVNGFPVSVPEPYMMFVSRISTAGNTSWTRLIHDVTFQSPRVAVSMNGEAFVSGNLLDTAVFGTVTFHHPQWVFDIFLTKVDSSGNFSWGVQVPLTSVIQGDFQRAKDNFLDVDANGNVYISGLLRGTVDWGNGVITTSGSVTNDGNSIISFDGNGIPRWQVTGIAASSITPYSLSVTGVDECYFTNSVRGTTMYDSVTTNSNGNFAFLIGKISDAASAGISETISENGIMVYPNPADQSAVIHSGSSVSVNDISVYDVVGKKIDVSNLISLNSSRSAEVDVSLLPPGVYFLVAGPAQTKLIVSHNH